MPMTITMPVRKPPATLISFGANWFIGVDATQLFLRAVDKLNTMASAGVRLVRRRAGLFDRMLVRWT